MLVVAAFLCVMMWVLVQPRIRDAAGASVVLYPQQDKLADWQKELLLRHMQEIRQPNDEVLKLEWAEYQAYLETCWRERGFK
jgi:hypothetical protein